MKRLQAGAFTLVEVVLSLSVLSFCLVVMMGLFGVGLNNGRKSSDDTTMASMLMQAASQLRSQNITGSANGTLYFDGVGQPLSNASSALYVCAYATTNPAPAQVAEPMDTNLTEISLIFSWPAGPHPAHVVTNYATLSPP